MSADDAPVGTPSGDLDGGTLNLKLRFYIPVEKDGAEEVVQRTCSRLTRFLGGATAYNAQGWYQPDGGGYEVERVTVVEAFGDPDMEMVAEIADDIKMSLNEESVAYEIETTEAVLH